MNELVGFYIHISYWYEYRATYCLAQKNITYIWKKYFQVTTIPSNKVLSSPSNKVWQEKKAI